MSMSLTCTDLSWDQPAPFAQAAGELGIYAEWFGDGGVLLAHRPNIYQQKFDAYYGKSVSRVARRRSSGQDRDPVSCLSSSR